MTKVFAMIGVNGGTKISMNKHEQHLKQLSTLNEITSILNQEVDFEVAVQAALERLVDLESLATGWVFLTSIQNTNFSRTVFFRIVADTGLPEALAQDDLRPLCEGGCDCQWLFNSGRLDTGVNIVHCSRLEREEGDKGGLELHASMPLLGQSGPVGILNLAAAGREQFSQETLDFLTTVGRQLGIAYERSQLQGLREKEIAYAATLEERQRLATDMHDSLAQLLFAAELSLSIAKESQDEVQQSQNVDKAAELVSASLSELKSLVEVMRPADLSHGLEHALRRLVSRMSESITTTIVVDRVVVDDTVAEAIYRIAQEALHNVLRHAEASEVWIRLGSRGKEILFSIEDDGVGLDPEHEEGLGMKNMAARAAQLNGTLSFIPKIPSGLELELRITKDDN